MTSLADLVTSSAPLLVLDTASAEIQLALVHSAAEIKFAASGREAGTGIYACLAELAIEISRIGAFVFCEGPGSTLGIRTAAMALRTWSVIGARPVYSYRSLEALAASRGDENITFIADARREMWHAQKFNQPLQRVLPQDLVGSLAMPENFRKWSALPVGTSLVPYRLEDILPGAYSVNILRECPNPDALQSEAPTYVQWEPQVHRAP